MQNSWKIELTAQFKKSFDKLDSQIQKQVLKFVTKLNNYPDPNILGKVLVGDKKGYSRFRIGNHRIIYKSYGNTLLLCIIDITHRQEVYDKNHYE
ncbi:hypothetical protein FACS1894152_7710 [Bacilli bacterium]|nr:hypothetical protein FACS1894152_7710 [Bacilli bacterium]